MGHQPFYRSQAPAKLTAFLFSERLRDCSLNRCASSRARNITNSPALSEEYMQSLPISSPSPETCYKQNAQPGLVALLNPRSRKSVTGPAWLNSKTSVKMKGEEEQEKEEDGEEEEKMKRKKGWWRRGRGGKMRLR